MTITIELKANAELLSAIRDLTSVLAGGGVKPASQAEKVERAVVPAPTPTPEMAVKPAPTPAEEKPSVPVAPAPAEDKPAAPASSIKVEQVRAAVQQLAIKGKREEVKALLTKYEAANVSSLDPARYEEFLSELNEL